MLVRALLAVAATAAVAAPVAEARNLYVGNELTSSVGIIETTTNTASGAIKVPHSPSRVGLTPDGSKLVVTFGSAGRVGLFDTATGAQIGPEAVAGASAYGPAISPDGGKAFVSSFVDEKVFTVDLGSMSILGEPINVGGALPDVALSPDGTKLYVVDFSNSYLLVYDARTGASITGVPVGGEPRAVAVSPDGTRVYVACEAGAGVTVVDAATNTVVVPNIPTGEATEIAVSPSGDRVYVGNYEQHNVVAIDALTSTVIGKGIPVGDIVSSLAVTPDGAQVYAGTPSGVVIPIDAAALTAGAPIPVSGEARGLVVTPDQPPRAAISGSVTNGVANLSAHLSSDPDSAIASYAWDLGGILSTGETVQRKLAFGPHAAALTLTDVEGCSTRFVFTGHTASCNGSGVAHASVNLQTIKVGKTKRKAKKGTATLTIKASGPGTVKLSGSQMKKAGKTVKNGKVVLTIKPKGKAKRKLAKSGVAKFQAEARFLPKDGLTVTQTVKVKLVQTG